MNKKIAAAVVAVPGTVLLAAGTLYECFFNRKLFDKVAHSDILVEPKVKEVFMQPGGVFEKGLEWYAAQEKETVSIRANGGNEIFADILRASDSTGKWAIVVHGYASKPEEMGHYACRYYENGYNVLLPHLKAHGLDKEKYCSMGYYDRYYVTAWIDYLVTEFPECEIVLHGVSMGSATVMLATGEKLPDNVKCAVADCGYTNCYSEYASQFRKILHLPAFPMLNIVNMISKLRGNFDLRKCSPDKAVARSETPTFFIHGEKDSFVPYAMLDKLYAACPAEKDKLSVKGAVHAASSLVDPERYWDRAERFISRYI